MLARAQRSAGACVTAVLLNEGTLANKLREINIQTHVLPESSLSAATILCRLVSVLATLKPQIVHTPRMKENILGAIAARIVGAVSVRTTHGAGESTVGRMQIGKTAARKLDQLIGRWFQQRIIAVTEDLRRTLTATYGSRHVVTIENGIDPNAFTSFSPGEYLAPSFADARHRVGLVGRLVRVKRVDLFSDMAAELDRAAQRDTRFFVIGDGPLRQELSERASAPSVCFLGEQRTIHPYIAALDVLVMCSDHEGLPMTLLEAMALGVPVVGHEVGGIAELLDGGRYGWPVQDHTPSAYADAVRKVLSQPAEAQRRAAAARNNVLSRYSAEAGARKHLKLYEQMIRYRQAK
jgi:glycosyltransferase involved in cell wall biosynthesis